MWQKKGLIFNVDGRFGWNKTHVYVPCADSNYPDKIRVYYSSRNQKGQCIPSFVDLDKNDPSQILFENPYPILELGSPGHFDDCGITPTWIMDVGTEKWLYYVGWNVHNTVPYHNAIGLATSTDGVNFIKKFSGPLISTIANEPLFNGTATVLFIDGLFKMWYLNCTQWLEHEGKIEPCYHIKYAESTNGIDWQRNATVAIDYKSDWEGGISRPSVIFENGLYKMWYSYRGKYSYRTAGADAYRIGYAESTDGKIWVRKDNEVGITVSNHGWDSDMVEYPNVISTDTGKIMFYNGNGFGASGLGWAIWPK